MTWLYTPSKSAQASACLVKDCELGSPTWASRIAPCATLSGKHTQPASWQRAWKKAPWMAHLSGPTFSPSTVQLGVDQWIASLRDSRAKTSALQADAQGLTVPAVASSSTSATLPTLAVRDTSFWRTSLASLLPPPPLWTKPKALSKSARPPESWENWPTVGGMRNDSLFQRPMWAPVMAAPGGSAGLGGAWTTPDVCSGARDMSKIDPELQKRADTKRTTGLPTEAAMWLTPNVPNGGRSVSEELVQSKGMTPEGEKRTVGLESQVRYWPTPSASIANDGESPETWHARAATLKAKHGNGNGAGLPLTIATAQWPTPAARDAKGPNSVDHMNRTDGAGIMPTSYPTLS